MRTIKGVVSVLLVAALALVFLPSPCVGYVQGDMNDDNDVSLSDAILIMRFLSKMSLTHSLQKEVGVGSDPRIGLDDLIYVLQVVSSLRSKNSSPVASFSLLVDSGDAPFSAEFDASVSSDSEGSIVSYLWDFGDGGSGSGALVSHVYGIPGMYQCTLTVVDEGGARGVFTKSIVVTGQTEPPPDPSTVAPPVDSTVATSVYSSTEFLYTGSNPIQTGVAPGTVDAKKAAVLRGKVLTSEGNPLPGVLIRILNRNEYGQTLSRMDGMFDLAVNGGEMLTVQYSKDGFLTAQRQASVPLQDFAFLPEVLLIQKDDQVSNIDLASAAPMQIAQGKVIADADGSRQATLLFPQGTAAAAVLPNGNTEPLSNLSVRITEYSVGPEGPKAMPAKLPPTVGYTYCVEFGVDEADALGAREVQFSQPLFHYVHNFLDFPIGMIVPVAYYDRQRGAWIASENGRVIKVIRINGGLAELDTDGDNLVDNGIALGISSTERETIAGVFNEGDSLWRAPITHFSPWDMNWGIGPPLDAQEPQQPSATPVDQITPDHPSSQPGWGSINIESQAFHETVAVSGSPFHLNYQSDRVEGRKTAYTFEVPLSGQNYPESLKRIDLEIHVAGQRHTQSFEPAPNLSTSFTWNGTDAYGRLLQGNQPIRIRVGFVYNGVYQYPVDTPLSFGRLSGVPISTNSSREEITLWQEQRGVIGTWNALLQGLGGWTVSVHHAYDPGASVVYYGDGRRDSAQSVSSIITTVAGGSSGYEFRNGVPATEIFLNGPADVAVNPDGGFYTSYTWSAYAGPGRYITYVDGNGIINTIAGTYDCSYPETYEDGIPAINACIIAKSFAVGPDGNLYIASDQRVRRVGPDGIITTVAGVNPMSDPVGFSGDGGPAVEAQMYDPQGIAFGLDGSLYITDTGNRRIRQVAPDGVITTVAGNGQWSCSDFCSCGDGGPAQSAALMNPVDVAVGPDGSLYIAEYTAIRKVGLDGIISTVICGMASYSSVLPKSWDEGIPASAAFAGRIRSIDFGPDGSLYFAACDEKDGSSSDTYCFVRRIGTDGIVKTVAGGVKGYSGDGGSPDQAQINIAVGNGGGMDVAADGRIYIADSNNNRVRAIRKSLPGVDMVEAVIPSRDGTVLHKFGTGGRHLETIHALTGSLLYQFNYDQNGLLTEIADGDGNRTAIERDSQGNPKAIIAPFGQRTALSLDTNGYLASITNPAAETYQFDYGEGGLLSKVRKPNGSEYLFTYDDTGRLTRTEDPASGWSALALSSVDNGQEVTLTTAMGRLSAYRNELFLSGERRRVSIFPDGTIFQVKTDGGGNSETTIPSGTVITQVQGSNPRFGLLAPYSASLRISTPGGRIYQKTENRTASLADPDDLFSLTNQVDTVTVNGRVYTTSYDGATKTFTDVSPQGRGMTSRIDDKGRLVWRQVGGLFAWNYGYDAKGRLSTVTVGEGEETRVVSFAYGPAGYFEAITDPIGRVAHFERDVSGRIIRNTLPDGGELSYGYDANENLISVTPPGRPNHSFAYTPVDLQSQYTAPQVGVENNSTGYMYNSDRRLTRFDWPDGRSLEVGYDSAGRAASLGSLREYSYDPVTGNLAAITAPNQSLSLSYDGTLLLSESWTGALSGSVGRTYNNNLKVASIGINGSQTFQLQYDDDNLLIGAGDLVLNRSAQNSSITGTQLGNVTDSWVYNRFGETMSYTAAYSGGAIYGVQYVRDKVGRIIEKTETVLGVNNTYDYSYEAAGRLSQVKKNGVISAQYTYDANGNRLNYNSAVSGTYDNQDRLTQYGGTVFTYNARGELQSKTAGSQTDSYQYDVLGNLTGVTISDGDQIEYVLDGRNRRVGKKVNGSLVRGFLYGSALKPVAELDGSGNVISAFVCGSKLNVPDYMVKSGNTYRIISDHLGSPRIVVDASTGIVAQRMDYDEFGRVIQDTSPGFQPFGFAGGLYDPDTSLVHFGAREYDSETGRWTSKDPIGFAGMDTNLYSYAKNDPVNFTDRTGLSGGQGNDQAQAYQVGEDTYYIPDSLIPYLQAEQDEINQQLFFAQSGHWSPSFSLTEGYPPGTPQYQENLQQLYNQQIFYDQLFPISGPVTPLPQLPPLVSTPIPIQPMPNTSNNPAVITQTGVYYE